MKQRWLSPCIGPRISLAALTLLAVWPSLGCSPKCLANEHSEVLVRVFERSRQISTSAVVSASGKTCGLDTYEPSANRYRCIVDPGADVDIEASLDGHTASTTIEATIDTCAGQKAPFMTVDLTP